MPRRATRTARGAARACATDEIRQCGAVCTLHKPVMNSEVKTPSPSHHALPHTSILQLNMLSKLKRGSGASAGHTAQSVRAKGLTGHNKGEREGAQAANKRALPTATLVAAAPPGVHRSWYDGRGGLSMRHDMVQFGGLSSTTRGLGQPTRTTQAGSGAGRHPSHSSCHQCTVGRPSTGTGTAFRAAAPRAAARDPRQASPDHASHPAVTTLSTSCWHTESADPMGPAQGRARGSLVNTTHHSPQDYSVHVRTGSGLATSPSRRHVSRMPAPAPTANPARSPRGRNPVTKSSHAMVAQLSSRSHPVGSRMGFRGGPLPGDRNGDFGLKEPAAVVVVVERKGEWHTPVSSRPVSSR